MFIAGGFAGLGGCIEIIAVQGRLMNTSFSIQYGFTGIAVALVGNNTPLGILLSGIFFGGLQAGALRMQILTGISSSMSQVIQAFVILFFTGRDMFRIKKA
jgi:simple sugar transport system permease protein